MAAFSSETGPDALYTIGHSNHPLETFIGLLATHRIGVLADVRSRPYSRFCPHFNFKSLEQYLPAANINYLYLGKELGGRPDKNDPANARFYTPDGHVRYSELAASPTFADGLNRLQAAMKDYRVAMMCSEEDPLKCHRYMLISKMLAPKGVPILHIRKDASLLMHVEVAPEDIMGGVPTPLATNQLSLF